MSSPENYSSPDVELSLLRSELAEIFQTQAEIAAFHQPDDLRQPVEIVLGGRGLLTDPAGKERDIKVHVRQRIDSTGINYLILTKQDENWYWRQINDTGATQIFDGSEAPLDTDAVAAVRYYLRSDNIEWIRKYSEECGENEDLYDRARQYAKREVVE